MQMTEEYERRVDHSLPAQNNKNKNKNTHIYFKVLHFLLTDCVNLCFNTLGKNKNLYLSRSMGIYLGRLGS